MKKIFSIIASFLIVAAFSSCNLTNKGDYEYARAEAYFAGDANNWEFDLMEYDEATGKNTIEITVAKSGETFKLLPQAAWGLEWDNANIDESMKDADFLDDPTPEYGKYKTTFADAGKYKIIMDVAAEKYTIEKL